jgi:uncharacterized membrane protein
MGYEQLMYVHLFTVVPCFFMGTALLLMTKGTLWHRRIGKTYMVLMLFTAIITVFMPARVGPTFLGHFGWIHSFSLLTIYTVPSAYLAIRRGDVKSHQRKMILLYFGALVIAGAFTFFPGRYLHEVFFGG